MGEIKKLQEKYILNFQKAVQVSPESSQKAYSSRLDISTDSGSEEGQLEMITLVTLSQGEPRVEGTWRLAACYHFAFVSPGEQSC